LTLTLLVTNSNIESRQDRFNWRLRSSCVSSLCFAFKNTWNINHITKPYADRDRQKYCRWL